MKHNVEILHLSLQPREMIILVSADPFIVSTHVLTVQVFHRLPLYANGVFERNTRVEVEKVVLEADFCWL